MNVQFFQREKTAQTVKKDGVYRFICYESLMQELRARQSTAIGRDRLRQRTNVEHALAHIGHWQGKRTRYIGLRKNLFDLRSRGCCP